MFDIFHNIFSICKGLHLYLKNNHLMKYRFYNNYFHPNDNNYLYILCSYVFPLYPFHYFHMIQIHCILCSFRNIFLIYYLLNNIQNSSKVHNFLNLQLNTTLYYHHKNDNYLTRHYSYLSKLNN